MNYRFKATERYWHAFYALSPAQKAAVRAAWSIFKVDPFDSRLGTHKIHRLSARYRMNVYSVVIEGDLRAAFYIEGDLVVTVDLGTHDIYCPGWAFVCFVYFVVPPPKTEAGSESQPHLHASRHASLDLKL